MKWTRLIAFTLIAQSLGGVAVLAASKAPQRAHRLSRPATPASIKVPINKDSRPMTEDEKVEQVLNRLTLGARPGDYEKVKSMGVREFIEAQLDPQSIAESPLVERQLAATSYLHQDSGSLINEYRDAIKEKNLLKAAQLKAQDEDSSEKPKVKDNPKRDLVKQAAQEYMDTRLTREIYSPRQLQEVMVDFWFNHFNICLKKGMDAVLIGPYEEQAIRPYALGRFRDLVGATCHHPAMLFYLDNWQNSGPGAPPLGPGAANKPGKGAKAKSGLNENYARELMELHTLGVDGGYSQKDVTEMARVLTGLSLPAPKLVQQGQLNPNWGAFYPNRHDNGDKLILGEVIKGSGEGEIEHCLDVLCRAPATAHHVCYQLAQYFVADEPPPALVDRLSKRFLESDGNIKEVMRTLISSPEFFDARYLNAKYKSPFRYAISAVRASGLQIEPDSYKGLLGFMVSQGQPLYGCLTPDGYKNTREAWLNSDSLLKRLNFATGLGAGKFPGAQGAPDPGQVASSFGDHLSAKTREVLAKTPERLQAGLLLGSPEFMNY